MLPKRPSESQKFPLPKTSKHRTALVNRFLKCFLKIYIFPMSITSSLKYRREWSCSHIILGLEMLVHIFDPYHDSFSHPFRFKLDFGGIIPWAPRRNEERLRHLPFYFSKPCNPAQLHSRNTPYYKRYLRISRTLRRIRMQILNALTVPIYRATQALTSPQYTSQRIGFGWGDYRLVINPNSQNFTQKRIDAWLASLLEKTGTQVHCQSPR